MSDRREKGREIAFGDRDLMWSLEEENVWSVRGRGGAVYRVELESGMCECPDKLYRSENEPKHRCKHWWAAWYRSPVPVSYHVRLYWGDRWVVAIGRCGVRIGYIGPYYSRHEADLAKSIMIEAAQFVAA